MDAYDYQIALYKRLPRGPIWPEQPGEQPNWDALLAAMSHEPATFEARADQAIIEVFPNTTTELLDEWAALVGLPEECTAELWPDLTIEQKRAAIVAKLRGRGEVNRPALEQTLQALVDTTHAALLHKQFPLFTCNSAAGHPAYSEQWAATWVFMYMIDLILNPDRFDLDWVCTGVVTPDADFSPVTEDETADEIEFVGSETLILDLPDAAGKRLYFSFWYKYDTGEPPNIAVQAADLSFVYNRQLGRDSCWERIEISVDVPAGAHTPRAIFVGEDTTFLLSWAHAGIHDAAIECQAVHKFPINTSGTWACIGEQDATPAPGLPTDPLPILF